MKLTVALATRKRPEVLVNTLRHFVGNSKLENTEIVVLADEDDPETLKAVAKAMLGPKVGVSVEPREDTLGEKYNRVLKVAPADVYQVAVDYAPVLTPGYDELVLGAASLFPDGIGCVYGPPANASFPTIQAPTAKLVDLLGGIYPKYFPFWFIDHWLDDVVETIQRVSPVDLQVDCNTHRGAKTTELRDVAFWAELFDSMQLERREQMSKVIDALEEPEWRKQILQKNHHRIEAYSMWVNHSVRMEQKNIEASRGDGPPDERYIRVKKAGEEKLASMLQRLQVASAVSKEAPQQHPGELRWLFDNIKGVKSVLEVGSCYGQLLKLFGEIAAPQAKLHAIDLGEHPGSKEKMKQVIDELKSKGFDSKVCFADSHSLEAVAWAKANGPYDLVFIDGDHTYEGARQDWVNYGGLGKLVAFHDIAHHDYGVRKLWSEIEKKEKTAKTISSSMGIGVVFNLEKQAVAA